uniref:NADH dehydrogenase subunit 2 n=1 Tax=Psychoda alternata TaxID=114594 RepID=UPI0022DCD924|nr:NADH dehydrogenase subunit 2 [Psychoda alternata]AQX36166.1 NADH dehydrogenase subunit 2 [Psychoda alternata]
MFNPSKLLFLICLILGMMMSISSTSLLGVWMGLEINLLSFIPLMINTNNLLSTEASLKYFLNQVLASLVMLFLMIFMMNNYIFIFFNSIYSPMMNLIICTMLMKLGAAPFHFWLPQVMDKISWSNNMILMTIQKIAPMIILSYMINSSFLLFIIVLNMIISMISGFNQTSLRKILAFSSINHMGWMFMGLIFNDTLWLNYFIFYCLFSIAIVMVFKSFNLSYIKQTFSLKINYLQKMLIFCSFLSLGGLPPFLGFFPKWMIIQYLSTFNVPILCLMVMCSLVILFFYLRICYSAFMIYNDFNIWKISLNKMNKMTLFSLFFMLFGLFIISFMFMVL